MKLPDITSPEYADKTPEQRVLRQLIEALLFEGIIPYEKMAVTQSREWLFKFSLEQQLYVCRGRVTAFDRIRLKSASICRLRKDGSTAKAELYGIVMGLPIAESRKEQLLVELEQTIRLCHWNNNHLRPHTLDRRCLGYEALEAAIHEGHLYHPCFKARTGFSLEDHENFGPEAGRSFQLVWLAVLRTHVRNNFPLAEENFWQRELDKEVVLLLSHRLRALGCDLSDYALMPMHPWQWDALKDRALSPVLSRGEVLYLGCAGDYYCATQSVRSLMNISNPLRATIKLPMNMINTSSLRTLEAHAVCSAPAISQWLHAVVQSDASFANQYPLILLKEYAGSLYKPTDDPQGHMDGQVAAIWRESVYNYLSPGEQAVPFTALALMEADARPFIANWCETHGLESWLVRLISVTVLPVWHLLVKHGIALEAHAQNMVLVHSNGWPQKIILRDFHESVEYVDDYLPSHENLPDFISLNPDYSNAEPNRYYWMTSIEALRELVMDTLFVFNLTEISHTIENYYGFSESRFWKVVYDQLAAYLEDNPCLKPRHALLRHNAARIYTESLLTRKMFGEKHAEFHHAITNPLCDTETVKSDLEYDLCE